LSTGTIDIPIIIDTKPKPNMKHFHYGVSNSCFEHVICQYSISFCLFILWQLTWFYLKFKNFFRFFLYYIFFHLWYIKRERSKPKQKIEKKSLQIKKIQQRNLGIINKHFNKCKIQVLVPFFVSIPHIIKLGNLIMGWVC